ncbi:MAG: glycosyltransferase family 39 protein [Chloroflexota bacterium]
MTSSPETTGPARYRRLLIVVLPVLLVLLIGFGLRVWNLNGIPPGLTHDEANHGREAIDILNGILLYFFPLNYGSEPLYSYTVALSMALFGQGLLALRLVNVVFGVATIAVTYLWATPRLGRPTALLGAALLAVSFWPLATSREALRAGMLPFFMVLAVWFFWRILERTAHNKPQRIGDTDDESNSGSVGGHLSFAIRDSSLIILITGFGVAIALTLHTYLAARVSWLLFPVFMVYLSFFHRSVFRRSWRPIMLGLALAGVLVVPMFLYLRAHPEMQTRLDMLDRPLQAIAAGEWRPILTNFRDAVLAFVWPGYGDGFLAYNIPGRPVFDQVSAVFFVAGLVVCLWRWRQPAYAFLLLWLLIGIIPSLITGSMANTTRNIAALPAVFLIAAVGFVVPATYLMSRFLGVDPSRPEPDQTPKLVLSFFITILALAWVVWAGWQSGRDYFLRWGDSPEVRGAYQHTLVSALNHLEVQYADAVPLVFSSVYPGPAHDSSITLVLASDRLAASQTARWIDARYGFALPRDEGTLMIIPSSTPPHPAFDPWLQPVEQITLRPNDLDPSFTLYKIDAEQVQAGIQSIKVIEPPAVFGGAVELIAADWLAKSIPAGETTELVTLWRVLDPSLAGPAVPPAFETEAMMFTHVLDPGGQILAQRDSLDVPSWAWLAGDLLVQIHPLTVPDGTPPGHYQAVVGIYDQGSGRRLAVGGEDVAAVPPLVVVP